MADNIIEINEEKVKDHLSKFVREMVEETLNAMLEAEADNLCKAQKNELSPFFGPDHKLVN
jgi:transposase-like protein